MRFNLRSYDLIKGYYFGTERSTRIIDYDLKCCMMGQKCKNNISGSYLQKRGDEDFTYLSSRDVSEIYRGFTTEINKKGRTTFDPASPFLHEEILTV